VTEEVLRHGGALSHHHGVGHNRARFVPEALGSGFSILQDLKRLLDPENIMNPGVLGLGGAPW
jgi:alkyldihydroxyacetonephosphate synthase